MIEVPDGWTLEPFSEVATFKAGRTPARANSAYWTGSGTRYPWVAISDMSDHGTVTEPKETITQAAFDEVFRGELSPAGTLIMSFKLTIGRIATLGVPAAHNEAIISIQPRADIDQRYLGYYLSHFDYNELQDRAIKGQTLNRDKISRIPVLLPPEPDRPLIADVLDLVRWGLSIEAASEARALQIKRAAMHTLFSSGLRGESQRDTDLGPIPSSWDLVPLGSRGRIGNGSTPKKSVRAYWNGGTFPWLTSAKVYDRTIMAAEAFVTDEALAKCHLPILKPGAVLVAITGQGKTLGHCAVLGIEATINQHLAYLQPDLDETNPNYVAGYLETQYDYLRQVASGGGSTKGALTCGFLRELPIPMPPTREEQDEIAEVLEALDRKIELHRHKRAVLEDLFQALLHRLVTGEIDVDDLDLSALPALEEALA